MFPGSVFAGKTSSTLAFNLLTDDRIYIPLNAGQAQPYFHCSDDGGTSTTINNSVGSPAMTIDSTPFSGNRDALDAATADGSLHDVSISSINFSDARWQDSGMYASNYYSTSWAFTGIIGNLTLDGTTYEGWDFIPRDESSPTQDVFGNTLEYSGSAGTGFDHTTLSPTVADSKAASIDPTLTMTFGETVNVNTGNITIYDASTLAVVEAIDVTSGSVTGGGTNTISITPSTLQNSTRYFVEVDAGAFTNGSSESYHGVTGHYAWRFDTTGVAGLLANHDFTGSYTTDSIGDLPDGWRGYSYDFETGDTRVRTLSDDVLTLEVTTGPDGTYHGIDQISPLSTGVTHEVTIRYKPTLKVGDPEIRLYDGSWTTVQLNTKDTDEWFVETFDLGSATNARFILSVRAGTSSDQSGILVDYVSVVAI